MAMNIEWDYAPNKRLDRPASSDRRPSNYKGYLRVQREKREEANQAKRSELLKNWR
jgi:hypothetical protein